MALIVEDGVGRQDAESYLSLADADVYHARRLNSAWASATELAREAALIKATSYLDNRYIWSGARTTSVQALEWPRDSLGIPQRIKQATAEAALRSLGAELSPDQGTTGIIQSETVKAGPVETSVTYAQGANRPTYAVIDDLVRPYLAGAGSVRIGRA